ncbi:MAG: hypothetical protein U5N26_11330 [Candidatus Marinimicrobia bacterium]|nr:hypothetical protein [Candidatus Neomarinimicrobiota bacterium]
MLSELRKKDHMMDIEHFILSLEGALDYFRANYHTIDNLNVFPVPDGDTGVNMLSDTRACGGSDKKIRKKGF